MKKRRKNIETLAIAVGTSPPSEFRLFVSGENSSEKGSFIFDEEAARLVLPAAAKKGTDYMIDLEHQALDEATPDPTARDARGWFRLEVRSGELWAASVRWTPDGQARLTEKRQRYVSPAFEVDPKTRRVTRIINVALTALPATHHTPALIAAAARGENSMSIAEFLKVCEALEIDVETTSLEDALAKIKGEAAPAKEEKPKEKAPPAPDAPAEDIAASARLRTLTGTTTLSAALGQIEVLVRERQTLAEERNSLVLAEHRRQCVRLVTEAGHAPSSVWASSEAGAPAKDYLRRMTLPEITAHADEAVRLAGGAPAAPRPHPLAPARGTADGIVEPGGRIVRTPDGDYAMRAREVDMLSGCDEQAVLAYARDMLRTKRAREEAGTR